MTISASNLPVFVKSVTYGRILAFTLQSDQAKSEADLKAAVNATYEGYKGKADINVSQKKLFEGSTKLVHSVGGSQEEANAAINSVNFGGFFKPMAATLAMPILYTVKQLKRKRQLLNIFVENAKYYAIESSIAPRGVEVQVGLASIEPTHGACETPYQFSSQLLTGSMTDYDNIFGSLLSLPFTLPKPVHFQDPPTSRTFNAPTAKDDNPKFVIKSAVSTPAALLGALADSFKTAEFQYPFDKDFGADGKYLFSTDVPGGMALRNCPSRFNYWMLRKFLY